MSFKIHSDPGMGTAAIEYLKGADEDFILGEVLCAEGGIVKKGGTDSTGKQQYICAGSVASTEVSVKLVPCQRITRDRIYSAPFKVAGTGVTVGDKVTLSDDALGLTAVKTNGVCEIVGLNSTAVGERALVRFS